MADHLPSPDGVPTWLVAALSVVGTVMSWKGLRPVGRWVARRIDLAQQTRVAERADFVSQLTAQLRAAREEMVEIRKDLAEETELRMALAVDNAVLNERVESLTRAMAEDKKECQRAIRALQNEIRTLQRAHRGEA